MRRHFPAHSGLCASALGNAKPLMGERGAPGATPTTGIETPTPSDLLPAGVAIPSPLIDPAQRGTGHNFSEVQRSGGGGAPVNAHKRPPLSAFSHPTFCSPSPLGLFLPCGGWLAASQPLFRPDGLQLAVRCRRRRWCASEF